MSNQFFLTKKNLRLIIATTLATGSFGVLASAMLPPNAMGFTPGWNCQADFNNNWMCRSQGVNNNTSMMYPQMNGYYSPPPVMAPVATPYSPQMMAPAAPSYPYMMVAPATPTTSANVMLHKPPIHDQGGGAAGQAIYTEIMRSIQGSYVLQWQAANNRESLEQLRRTHDALAEAVIVEYHRQGKQWFVLLDGPFNDRRQAMQALKQSPRSHLAGDLFPWTRSVDSMRRLKMRYASKRINNEYVLNRQHYQNQSQNQNPTRSSYSDSNFYDRGFQNGSEDNQGGGRYEESPEIEYPAGYNFSKSQQKVPEQVETIDRFTEYFKDAYPVGDMEAQVREEEQNHWQVSTFERKPDKWDSRQDVSAMGYSNTFRNEESRGQRYNHLNKMDNKRLVRNSRDGVLRHGSGFVIQWQAAHNENSLKRIQQRYPELGSTHIVHYRKHDRDWFVLVSDPFENRDQANKFLMGSTIVAISTRLYPRVKKLLGLQQLLGYSKPLQKSRNPQNRFHISQVLGKSGDYTIQWYATSHLEMIHQMKRKFPELATAVTVRLRRNNKDWYVLVQGEYGNNKDALLALSSPKFREVAQQLRPWTRSIKSIKIQKYRDS